MGKKELKGIEEEGRNKAVELDISEPNNQALVVSIVKRNDERKGNANPIMSPEAEAYQNEQAESSRQQGNNSKLVKMLRKMEQRMKERDIQLKAQLKERDQFVYAKIRIRDRYMDEVIRHRDLEWKEESERRDHMWRDELYKRDEAYWQGLYTRGMMI